MADYFPLLARAVAALDAADARRAVYQHARGALMTQLSALTPALEDSEITRERLQLEEAIRKVETNALLRRLAEANGVSATEAVGEFTPKMKRQHGHNTSAQLIGDNDPFAGLGSGTADAVTKVRRPTVEALTSLAERIKERKHTAAFAAQDGVFRFATITTEADRKVAIDPLTRELQLELRRKARELSNRTLRLSNQDGWSGLAEAAGLIAEAIDRPAAEIADEIGAVWRLSISLGGFVEQDAEARARPGGTVEPLETDELRFLRELATTAGPWIRRFPTGRMLDDETHEFSPRGEIDPAMKFFRRAEQAALFRDDDAKAIRIALSANDRDAACANRARSWSILAVRNAGIAMIRVLGVGAAEDGMRIATELVKRIEMVVLDSEEELLELLSPRTRILNIVLRRSED
jgi:hypothetical protein